MQCAYILHSEDFAPHRSQLVCPVNDQCHTCRYFLCCYCVCCVWLLSCCLRRCAHSTLCDALSFSRSLTCVLSLASLSLADTTGRNTEFECESEDERNKWVIKLRGILPFYPPLTLSFYFPPAVRSYFVLSVMSVCDVFGIIRIRKSKLCLPPFITPVLSPHFPSSLPPFLYSSVCLSFHPSRPLVFLRSHLHTNKQIIIHRGSTIHQASSQIGWNHDES